MKNHKKWTTVPLFVIIITALIFVISRQSAAAAIDQIEPIVEPTGLFVPVDAQAPAKQSDGITARQMTVDEAYLAELDVQKPIVLNLFADMVYTAVFTQRQQNPSGNVVWIGKLQGQPQSQIILLQSGNDVYADIFAMDNGNYRIYPLLEKGLHQIEQAGPETYGITADDGVLVDETMLKTAVFPAIPQNVAATDDGSIVDILVVYSNQVDGNMAQASAELAIAYTNQAYANSGINHRLSLVAVADIDYDEAGDMYVDLPAIKAHGETAALRNEYHADLVLLYTYMEDLCGGIAYLGPNREESGFALSSICHGSTNYLVAHETGHNLGANHDWYVQDSQFPFPHAHGHVNLDSPFRTIMSYNSLCWEASGYNCPAIPHFSNPDESYNGYPTGVPIGTNTSCVIGNTNNPPCDADVRQMFNDNILSVAQYRSSQLIWTGSQSADWANANNWEIQEGAPGSTTTVHRLPRAIDNIYIPSGLSNYPVINNGTHDIRDLTIAANASLQINDGTLQINDSLTIADDALLEMNDGTLQIAHNWIEEGNGNFTANGGTVIFNGGQVQAITTNANSYFHNLQIGDGQTALQVTLQSDININGNLDLQPYSSFIGGAHILEIKGDWTEENNSSFAPENSTVIFAGTTQIVATSHLTTTLSEDFNAPDSSYCGYLLQSDWASDGYGYYFQCEFISGEMTANRWRESTDTYLFTSILNLLPDFEYQLDYEVATWQHSGGDGVLSPQTVSIVLATGQTRGSIIEILSPPADETGTSLESRTVNFTVTDAGSYYIGFRAQQTGDDYTLFDDIVLTHPGLRFYNLELHSSNSVTFDQGITILNDLSVTSSTLADFGDYDVTVEGSVINNGSIRQRKQVLSGVTTELGRIVNNNGDIVKYEGVALTPESSGLGWTAVTISGNQPNCVPGATLAHRCFTIEPANPQPTAVRFWYLNSESGAENPAAMKAYRQSGSAWPHLIPAATPRGTVGAYHWVEAIGVTDFPVFGLADSHPTGATETVEITLSPNDAQIGVNGTTITYTVTITNSGNVADTFNLSLSGQEWTSQLDTTAVSLAGGADGTFALSVMVPANATDGDMDTVTVTAVSQTDSTIEDSTNLTTTAQEAELLAVTLSPNDTQTGVSGRTITYTLTIANDGNVADTYDLSLSGQAWTSQLDTTAVSLVGGANASFTLSVAIPANAGDGDMDTIVVTAVSRTNSAIQDTVTLTTTAQEIENYFIFLPMITK